MGIPTVPATSLQIHALRARGSIDPSSGKLLRYDLCLSCIFC